MSRLLSASLSSSNQGVVAASMFASSIVFHRLLTSSASYSSPTLLGLRLRLPLLTRVLFKYVHGRASDHAKYGDDCAYLHFEDVRSERSLSFATSHNARTIATHGDPTGTPIHSALLASMESVEKIPYASCIGSTHVYNLWTDKKILRGLWRRCPVGTYLSCTPSTCSSLEWETVLDIDALNKALNKSYVYKGSRSCPSYMDSNPDNRENGVVQRSLLSLSPGGGDACEIHEFDLPSCRFVRDLASDKPFELPVSKSRVSYKSRDVLYVAYADASNPETLTNSGYPLSVYEWERGDAFPLPGQKPVFTGEKEDVSVDCWLSDERRRLAPTRPGSLYEVRRRSTTFYTSRTEVRPLRGIENCLPKRQRENEAPLPPFRPVPVPEDVEVDFFAGFVLLELRKGWGPNNSEEFKAGSLLAVPFETLMSGSFVRADFQVIFSPTPNSSLSTYTKTRSYLILTVLEDVKSRFVFLNVDSAGTWTAGHSELGSGGASKIATMTARSFDDSESDRFWIDDSSFGTPTTLAIAEAGGGDIFKRPDKSSNAIAPVGPFADSIRNIAGLPHFFDSSDLVICQKFATSKDGTKVPYFMIHKSSVDFKVSQPPTLVYGYGGFEISLTPGYRATSGIAWLNRGGVYVEANIRGGGEYGPTWHQAALKANRNKAYEDMIAVGEDLVSAGVCSPKTLGCRGGSNGGLLVGNMLTMKPELWGAIHCAVPLLDMRRYNVLLAGASWMAEYGDPDKEEEWKFLQRYSPFHNIVPKSEGVTYPKILITTSTMDDRVHPAHARKMVAKLTDLGHEETTFYYENIEGGHGGGADAKQMSFLSAVEYNFLWKHLGGTL